MIVENSRHLKGVRFLTKLSVTERVSTNLAARQRNALNYQLLILHYPFSLAGFPQSHGHVVTAHLELRGEAGGKFLYVLDDLRSLGRLKELRRTVPLVQSRDKRETLEFAVPDMAAHQHGKKHMVGALLIVKVVNKIAQRVKYRLALVNLDGLENVRMMAGHHVCAGVDSEMTHFCLIFRKLAGSPRSG
jgi:hypothetical protein